MNSSEIRKRYLDFFKTRGHTDIGSASLRPENDPTTLFTGSGMQPLLPYLLGEKHPKGVRLTNSQKCFRAEDIEEVGDNRHTTFFEMLGNWSLGDYFKKEQLRWFFEFLTDKEKGAGLPPEKLYVTVFLGDKELGISRDTESVEIWKSLFKEKGIDAKDVVIGSEEEGYKKGMQKGRIFYYDAKKNWWSRSGTPEKMPPGEPGGPDSEVFYDFGTEHDTKFGEYCHPNCDCGRFMEIGNSVFMEYIKQKKGSFAPLPQKNVDFGGGLERITAASNNDPDIFTIDIFSRIIGEIEHASGLTYVHPGNKRAFRIIADHVRAAVFLIADGVEPSNKDAGYFVRRLLRRAILQLHSLRPKTRIVFPVSAIANLYGSQYPEIKKNIHEIEEKIVLEETRFVSTLERGLKEFERISSETAKISGDQAYMLFTTYGFPYEITEEIAREKGINVDKNAFEMNMKKHQELSRAGAEQKFKGGLADTSEQTTALHTATHLLLAGLRKELGKDVHQAGSNITAERARFDFTYPEKVGRDVLDKVEQYVNNAIIAGAERIVEEMPREEAKSSGVEGSFWERYPDTVKVFAFRDQSGVTWSHELCGGPHVENTKDIKGRFKIVKEEAVAAGVRRVKAILE